jgi:NAD(P)-dependent dehydrogenase (short-subunit alcohol dehydrogenase family)
MDMKDKVVVITGASSGIGRATAHAFAKRGASLMLAARSDQQLDVVERECADLGVRAIGVPTDVAENDEVEALAAEAQRQYGRFDVWVNNAGVLLLGRIDEAPVEDFERVIDTNLLGTAYGSRVALKHFRGRGEGTLINVSSIVSGMGQLYSSAYTASKWGVRGMGEALRMELADQPGIHVCTVMPAAIDTPIFQHAANYVGKDVKALAPVYPPERVAEEIVSLVTNPKAEVTVGDAGRLMQLGRSLLPQALVTRLGAPAQEMGLFTDQPEGAHTGNLYDPSGPTAAVRGGWEGKVPSGDTADTVMRGLGIGVVGFGLAYLAWSLIGGRSGGGDRSSRGATGGTGGYGYDYGYYRG